MEPVSAAVGLGVGIVSVASIFQTCLHGYRSLNSAMAIGNTAITLNIQFRVEELRLYLWGRNWGLVIDLESENTDSPANLDDEKRGSGENTLKLERAVAIDRAADDELEIPGLRDLTFEILGRIQASLEEWKTIGQRYGITASSSSPSIASSGGKATLSNIMAIQETQSSKISTRTKLSSKLRWAMTDKGLLEELLSKLTNLNDSLEKLLPKKERVSLARGLAAELLILLENATQGNPNSSPNAREQLGQLKSFDEAKASNIVGLKNINQTEVGERHKEKLDPEAGPKEGLEELSSPFAKSSVWSETKEVNMEIPFDHFVRLAKPKINYYHIQKDSGRWISGRYAPLPRSLAILSPPLIDKPNAPSNTLARVTLIEWRPTAHESKASELTEAELKGRRNHIARLLHRTSTTDSDFRILDCIGYTKSAGHTPDGVAHELVGYVYEYPTFASSKLLPVSLREVLGQAYTSSNPKVPSLEARFRLARHLSIALYQLQCAGWVHRKVSSYNVIFFQNSQTGELDLDHPYLVGWQYSRPDDQRRLYPSERQAPGIGDLDMYVHRRRIRVDSGNPLPRFRKSFDIYSLGIVLIEVAFWEPIMSLASQKEREKMDKFEDVESSSKTEQWWTDIERTSREELAPEMGEAYRDAVMFCLVGSGEKDMARWDKMKDGILRTRSGGNGRERDMWFDDGFEEVGIEKEFYWGVVKKLEEIRL